MYPFDSRLRWLFSGQWGHILAALDRRPHWRDDEVLADRADALQFWNRVRSAIMVMLSLGLIATAIAWFARFLPGATEAEEATNVVAASLSSVTGFLTVLYLFLTRLLGQIETDIWARMVIEPNSVVHQ